MTKVKKYFAVQFPGKLPAPLKFSISQPLMLRIQQNLNLSSSGPKHIDQSIKITLPCSFPANPRHQLYKVYISLYWSEFNQIWNLSSKKNFAVQFFYFSVQFPGKIPGISEIKHSSAITQQNSTKFET